MLSWLVQNEASACGVIMLKEEDDRLHGKQHQFRDVDVAATEVTVKEAVLEVPLMKLPKLSLPCWFSSVSLCSRSTGKPNIPYP
jgi:hypothetical protein